MATRTTTNSHHLNIVSYTGISKMQSCSGGRNDLSCGFKYDGQTIQIGHLNRQNQRSCCEKIVKTVDGCLNNSSVRCAHPQRKQNQLYNKESNCNIQYFLHYVCVGGTLCFKLVHQANNKNWIYAKVTFYANILCVCVGGGSVLYIWAAGKQQEFYANISCVPLCFTLSCRQANLAFLYSVTCACGLCF